MFFVSINVDHSITSGNSSFLWGPTEPTTASSRNLRHHFLRQHVDAQRRHRRHDDARRHRNSTPFSGPFLPFRRRDQVLQGRHFGGHLRYPHRRYEHSHRHRRQSHTRRNVEELFSPCRCYKL